MGNAFRVKTLVFVLVVLFSVVTIVASVSPAQSSSELGTRRAPSRPAAAASVRSGPAAARSAPRAAAARSTPDKGVSATVRTDGAMVYSQPDFDANVLTNLRQGDRVRVSSGTTGSYAKFHKVRAGSVLGYIAEIDVQVDGAPKKRDHRKGDPGKVKDKKKPFEATPILFNKYVGVTMGALGFRENVSGVDSKQTLLVYGLKVTGPDTLIKGPISDFDLVLHYGAPSYYSSLSSTQPTGFVIFTDWKLLYPFMNHDAFIFTIGLGPALKFSSFSVTSGGNQQSLSQLDLGLSAQAMASFKIGRRAAVRLEGKYIWEKNSETLFALALQQQFE